MRNAFDAGSIHYLGKWGGGGWALEIESFLGPVKWHRADRRVPFGAHKTRGGQNKEAWIRTDQREGMRLYVALKNRS